MRTTRPTLIAAATLAVACIPTHVTGAPISPDLVRLHPIVMHVGMATAVPLNTEQCQRDDRIACYGPEQLQRAYDLDPLFAQGDTGQGQTIAIVDSFGSPTITNDLAVFDDTYGLPTPKLTVVQRPARSRPTTTAPRGPAGPARRRWTSSGRTRSRRGRTCCWSRHRPRRTRAPRASRRSRPPRSTSSTTGSPV